MNPSKCVIMGLLVVGLCLTACQNSSKTRTLVSDVTYTLVAVNGNKVPYTPVPEGSAPQVESGAFTLNTDGTVTHATNFGQVDGRNSATIPVAPTPWTALASVCNGRVLAQLPPRSRETR